MQDAKTGGSRWVPDIREDEITEFQEQNGDETATYKAVNVHPIISRILDKLAFFRTHVSAVWYNKLANKTVKDKLDEIDTSISSLNSSRKWKLLGTAQGNGMGSGTSVNISSILDTASEIMLILDYQYNKSGDRANFSVHVVPQGEFKRIYAGGFYFSASNYACLGVRITNKNYAVIDGSWWHVQESASAVIPLDNDTGTLHVYYR